MKYFKFYSIENKINRNRNLNKFFDYKSLVQEVGSKLYFDSLNSYRRPYYCVILAMSTLARELKRFEDLTLHHPLVHEDYMITKDNL